MKFQPMEIVEEDHVFYTYPRKKYSVIERGEGIYLYDEEGKRYIDAPGGALVVTIGHGVKKIAEVMKEQAEKGAFLSRTQFTNRPLQGLAKRISMMAPGDLDKVILTSGGSEAVEVAIKLARKYHVERKNFSKFKIISRWESYHGNTIAGLSLSGHTSRRKDYIPLLFNHPHIPPAYCYRCPLDKEYPKCNIDCARILEGVILQEGPENISAFIAEPIVGATVAALIPPKEYFPIIREICEKYDVVMIMDEVMTGFGRTGRNFAIDHWGVIPDIITFAKGVASGYFPIGGIVAKNKFFQAVKENSGIFLGGYTFSGNPLACAVGIAVLDYVQENDLIRRSAMMGDYFLDRLKILQTHPSVGDIRGKGLMLGIEFVKNKTTKEPFDPKFHYTQRIVDRALSKGLILYPGGPCVDGVRGDDILIGPPFIITESQIDEIMEILDETITEVEEELSEQIGR